MQPMPPPVHMPDVNAPIAQLATLFKNTCELGHVCETQPLKQVKLIIGMPPPPPVKSKQPNKQVRPSKQLCRTHCPQSAGQFVQVSCWSGSQRMFPQKAHEPQSCEQLAHVSGARQRPSPHEGQLPQSAGQVLQSSPAEAWHM